MTGPLKGIRIIEFAGIGPGPFCGMMLADHGAEVIRIERPGQATDAHDVLQRSRRSIALNVKSPEGLQLAKELCKSADGVIEGYRPGVMERLGVGPDVLLAENPDLVFGRMTGWGQTGPLAHAAGHDINYISINGVLHTVGEYKGRPIPPVNYLGDFAGGGMMLAFGMVAALLAVKAGTAKGQVIDCAMTDGAAVIAAMTWSQLNAGVWEDDRGINRLDGGAHFYDTYECKDGKFIGMGSIEPQFYAIMREKMGLADDPDFDDHMAMPLPKDKWRKLKVKVAAAVKTKTRDEWNAIFEGTDGCIAPVLSMAEALEYSHNVARGTFIKVNGEPQPAPAPRFSVTVSDAPRPVPETGADTDAILQELGYSPDKVVKLKAVGAI